jgi:hypothetical protein
MGTARRATRTEFEACSRRRIDMVPHEKQSSTPAPSHDEGFEFELTDLDEARRVLDSESMSQFDVATVASPAQWKRIRRVPLPTDRALGGRAMTGC